MCNETEQLIYVICLKWVQKITSTAAFLPKHHLSKHKAFQQLTFREPVVLALLWKPQQRLFHANVNRISLFSCSAVYQEPAGINWAKFNLVTGTASFFHCQEATNVWAHVTDAMIWICWGTLWRAFLQANDENDELTHDGLLPESRESTCKQRSKSKGGTETASGGPCYSWESASR